MARETGPTNAGTPSDVLPDSVEVLQTQLQALQHALRTTEQAASRLRQQAEAGLWLDGTFPSPFTRNLPCLAFLKDSQGRYVYVNELWEKTFQHAVRDWHLKSDSDLWPEAVAERLRAGDVAMTQKGSDVQSLETLPGPGGETEWLITRFPVAGQRGEATVGGLAVDVTERRRAERALADNERRYRELFDGVLSGIYRTSREGRVLLANRALVRMLGYESLEELLRINVAAKTRRRAEFIRSIERDGSVSGWEGVWLCKDGRELPVRENAKAVRDEQGRLAYYEGVVEDITGEKRARVLEADRNQILEMVARNGPLDKVLSELCLLLERQIAGSLCCVTLLKDDMRLYPATGPSLPAEWMKILSAGAELPGPAPCHDAFVLPEWKGLRADALSRGLQCCWTVPISSGERGMLGALAIHFRAPYKPSTQDEDLAEMASKLASVAIEHRQLHDELVFQAKTDYLTGLPNRLAFEDWLRQALSAGGRHGSRVSVLWIDLDRFKEVNDTLGHRVGDMLLRASAERLQQSLHATERLARLGGDEFGVILAGPHERELAEQCATRVIEGMREPFHLGGYELFVNASIGICSYPEDGSDAATLQRHADRAMYTAKGRGGNRFERFNAQLREGELHRLELESGLRRAIKHNELALYYQPQLDLDGNLQGLEALLRWRHPKFGILTPGQFIPIAEETGLIVAIGDWVVEEACRQCAVWNRAGYRPIKIAVNVSAMQFYFSDFAETVKRALESAALSPSLLEIELTESLVMRNLDECIRQMQRLRNLGVRIAIDDFGTGYSSLSYLQQLPLDALKIDRSFLEKTDPHGTGALLRGITDLGHSLGLSVLQEGVETADQLEILKRIHVDFAQGYFLGRPMPPSAAANLLHT